MTQSFRVCVLALTVTLGIAQSGLRANSRLNEERINAEYVEQSLLAELGGALGHGGDSEKRLANLEKELRPMYSALPKSLHGGLDHAVVRFALHRFFVQRHGWYVKGLEPAGDAWNASSPTDIFKDRVPSYALDLVEQRLESRGLGLRELAVLAATLEDLVHSELIERLTSAYTANQISTDGKLTESQAKLVVETYMMFFILPIGDHSKFRPKDVKARLKVAPKVYPGWHDTMMWVHDVRHGLEHLERSKRNAFVGTSMDFASSAHVVEQVGEQFGRFQDLECRSLKDALLQMEHQGSGRVRLPSFYSQALGGDWQFSESLEYLRHLGALDETDPSNPSVVIPNYLTSRTNCLATSSFYSVCCIDECESLMGSLEKHIQAPMASPQQIASFISTLSSDTVEAPRNLSTALLKRLEEVSVHHGGSVPLHGRLFAQWMHHAYPRECPYPHVAGAVDAPRTPDEWMAEFGGNTSSVTSEEQMRVITASYAGEQNGSTAETLELPWLSDEDLVVFKKPIREDKLGGSLLRAVAFAAALGSMVLTLFRTSKSKVAELPIYSGKSTTSSAWFSLGASKAHYV